MRKNRDHTELGRQVARARKRVARMAVTEMLSWADTAVSGVGRGFSDYVRDGQVESLLEIRDQALPALIAVVEELIAKDEAARS